MHHRKRPTPALLLPPFAALAVACGGGASVRESECGAQYLPGDLVITEIFANPAGADEGNEWFEIYNASQTALDLSGLILQTAKDDGSSVKEHVIAGLAIEPGAYVVVGGVVEEARPDHVDYGYGNDLGDLRNTAGALAIACGETAIDAVLYAEATDATSRGFDGARAPDATANDDLLLWCDATTAFGDEITGTPGAVNDACAGVGVPTTCTEDGVVRDIIAPQIGDLVINEFHADPQIVDDDAGEWFEILATARVDLNGVGFGKSIDEVTGSIGAAECITMEPGSYFVVARGEDPASNGGLPVVDALFDFSLGNSTGGLVLTYGEDLLDEIAWTGTDPGATSSLDPDFASSDGNDNPDAFCAATTPYGDGDLGTPGAANDVECAVAPPVGQCFDGNAYVDVMAPAAGSLVITEFHANPGVVDDTDGEFFEIRALAPFHLNGLELGREGTVETVVEANDCILVGTDDHVVFAREADSTINGGLDAVATTFDFSLGNSDGSLFVGYAGSVLDEITWTSSTSGASTALDPAVTDPAGNDDETAWCASTTAYGDGDFGSPAAPNPACGTVNPTTCNDGGSQRDVVAPVAGDLVITEFMANPNAVGDEQGEWFELLVNADVDLNGLELGREVGSVDVTVPSDGDCIAVSAGTRVVLARNPDPLTNGGLEGVVATFDFGLTNSGGSLFIGRGGEALDAITWTSTTAGAASSLDPAFENPTDNDDQSNFCAAVAPYGAGDLGTPGGVGAMCGSGKVEGMCDDGGNLRPIVPASPGDLVISETMANPALVADSEGEWFEVAALADVDLNGLQLFNNDGQGAPSSTLGGAACIEATAGLRVLFVRNPMAAENGGLPDGGLVFGFGLVNANGALAIGVDGVVLDAVSWTSTVSGSSRALDEGSIDPVANDDGTAWCTASTPYNGSDNGTPAGANDCP
jgi:hypothetical protein